MNLWVAIQYVLPHRLLSRVVFFATRWQFTPWKNWLIETFVRRFKVDMSEAEIERTQAYPHFNAFFTRALKAHARAYDADPSVLLMPADGTMSQLGYIEAGRMVQAKGHTYSVAELLADEALAESFVRSQFVTIYLSPRDYHRVHMPMAGRLLETIHIPGRIFSVAPGNIEAVPRLFARNERLVCLFETANGPMAIVLVGALLVSGIETVWGGVEVPPYASRITRKKYTSTTSSIKLERFAELGRFNMGSTVILLLPPRVELASNIQAGDTTKLGQTLGKT
jgi:phosphatidylserine decarboxylase